MIRRLRDYEIGRRLGKGGMAEVYAGIHHSPDGVDKAVAIKVLDTTDLAEPETARELFLREAKLSAQLNHPNITQLLAYGREGDDSFIVLEWVDGQNLWELIQRLNETGTLLPPQIAAYILGQLCHALIFAHGFRHDDGNVGIIHRDVTPHNVMISRSGAVKLTDFGIAKIAAKHTTRRDTGGKLSYMAPEQFHGGPRTTNLDIYGLGTVLHEMLSGKPLRDARTEDEEYTELFSGKIPELDRPEVPAELDALRKRLLDRDWDARPQSASAVLDELKKHPWFVDSAVELGKLCERYMPRADAGPRSGLHEAVSAPAPDAATPRPALAHTPTASAPIEREPTVPEHGSPSTTALPRALPLVALLLLAAVLGGVVSGVTVFMLVRNPDPTVDPASAAEPVAPTPAPARNPEPPKPANEQPEPAASPPPTKAEPPISLDSVATAGKSTPLGEIPAKDEKKPAAKKKRSVPVNFLLDGPRYAEVQIDGRRIVRLQPRVDTKLTVGRHRLRWRLASKGPWDRGPTITLKPGRKYVIDITATGPVLSDQGPSR